MNKAIEWMAKNSVAANILLLAIIIGGIIVAPTIDQEVFPEHESDSLTVSVSYPGAGPSEIETSICLPLENAVSEVDDIKEIVCTAREESASLAIEMVEDAPVKEVLDNVKTAVEAIGDLPEDSNDPIVRDGSHRHEVMSVMLSGEIPEIVLFEYANKIRENILSVQGVNYASVSGARQTEILIEVTPGTLNNFGLTISQLAGIIKEASLDLPGGSIRTGTGKILLRTTSKRDTIEEFSRIAVLVAKGGSTIYLGDIANIQEKLEDAHSFTLFDGKPAVRLRIFQSKDYTPMEMSRRVNEFLDQYRAELPYGLALDIWSDRSTMFKSRFEMLIRNGAIGLVLVIIVLTLFLETRLAFWVMLGIPISFLGSLIFLPWLGLSINMNSLFAFILVLGIVVDDAIVVGENIYQHREMGKGFLEASIAGCKEMAAPVTFAIITTMVAFAPLLFIEGRLGSFVYAIPVVVISVIGISLFECLFILPAHLSHSSPKPLGGPFLVIEFLRSFCDRALKWTIRRPFQSVLEFSLKYRYFTAATSSFILMVSIGMVLGGIIPMSFFPRMESDEVTVTVELPPGYPAEEAIKIVNKIQDVGIRMARQIDEKAANGKKSINHIRTTVQSQSRRNPSMSTSASVRIQFNEEDNRNLSTSKFGRQWQRSLRAFPEVESINIRARGFSFGSDIKILFSHEDSEKLIEIIEKVKLALTKYEGIKEIVDSEKDGSREYRFTLTNDARTMGITPTAFAKKLRSAYQGEEVITLKKPLEEVPVIVLYPKHYRENINTLETLNIMAPSGGMISLGEAARIIEGVEPIAIRRVDKRRVVEVTAGVEDNAEDPEEIISAFQKDFLDNLLIEYPNLHYQVKGRRVERTKAMNSLWLGFSAALLGVYALLAIFFTSYSQPFLVMSTIPFGIAGAVAGHYILGYSVTFISLFGLVGLTGVVVNDSLILINTINRNIEKYKTLAEVLIESTKTRFRPIVLTSVTTFAGLAPILAESSRQAKFLIPMGISLGVGIMFATLITLILVPAFYLILEDCKNLVEKITGGKKKSISHSSV